MGHSGMQDFWVSLAGPRGRVLLSSIDKKSIFMLPYRAVPAVCGSIPLHAVGLAGGGRATSALGAMGGASAQPPLAARELEHVERGRERGCWSSSTPSLPVQGELRHRQCSCVPVSGKEARKKG